MIFPTKKNTLRDVIVNSDSLNLGRHQFVANSRGQLNSFARHSLHCFERSSFL